MLRIPCPHCGPRDEVEFRYRGDASVQRPAGDAGVEAFQAYVYERANPDGWHHEWWLHVGGCRQVIKIVRHALTHAIAAVGSPRDELLPKPHPEPVEGSRISQPPNDGLDLRQARDEAE